MGQRNLRLTNEQIAAKLWDWTPLNKAFEGSKIRVSDIDGIVERRGHFLFIEGKPSQKLPRGQSILFKQLANSPKSTVVVIVGNPPRDVKKWYANGEMKTGKWVEGNYDKFTEWVASWFKMANT